ncbi:hypothetical protein ACFQS7_10285 [Dankookia sp. GCM10030260]|uniref:hypothetical protein n=1 Tax=Dankookia sp. GCM10030260 TaxID=3273390 RepID=UPI003615D254
MRGRDRRHDDNGQGRVKDPGRDGRRKANREGGLPLGAPYGRAGSEPTDKGKVAKPARDGRLKANRRRSAPSGRTRRAAGPAVAAP